MNTLVKTYYHARCLIPRSVQIRMRQCLVRHQRSACKDTWPISPQSAVSRPPWSRWPGKKEFAVVLTHDVETEVGLKRCIPLMKLEHKLGFRSSFNFVPERYTTPLLLRTILKEEGHEVGVHGLFHDGKLYNSKKIFMARAARINEYLEAWDAVGFRSPSMHHNLEWLHALNVQYDLSTFDTDPFEPDSTGLNTIFPQWIAKGANNAGYAELPYTLPQDSTLYLLLKETDIGIWKLKLDWLVEQGGMALINTHPDYMDFSSRTPSNQTYPATHYQEFLQYIRSKYTGRYWHALPHEMASFTTLYYQKK